MSVVVASKRNPTVVALAALARSSRDQRHEGVCFLEGEHLISQFLEHQANEPAAQLETLIVGRDASIDFPATRVLAVEPSLMNMFSDLATPPQVIAVAKTPKHNRPNRAAQAEAHLAIDDVQDPGNVGALLRTAAAAGVARVWMSGGCAYPWSQKVLRASQGAQFALNIQDGVDLLKMFDSWSGDCVVSSLDNATELYSAKFSATRSTLFVVGNEGAGVRPALQALATQRVRIPMAQGIDSLNVAVAAGVILYEWARQCRHL